MPKCRPPKAGNQTETKRREGRGKGKTFSRPKSAVSLSRLVDPDGTGGALDCAALVSVRCIARQRLIEYDHRLIASPCDARRTEERLVEPCVCLGPTRRYRAAFGRHILVTWHVLVSAGPQEAGCSPALKSARTEHPHRVRQQKLAVWLVPAIPQLAVRAQASADHARG